MNSVISKALDRVAISMAVICGIHCLVTPILLVVLPILATTFWVDENFHLWMLLLVIPTTTLAVWSGCRRHKDKWVVASAALGLGILVTALIAERLDHAHGHDTFHAHSQGMEADSDVSREPGTDTHSPARPESSENGGGTQAKTASLSWHALLNTLGGIFLVAGHVRNFLLCRKDSCSHEEDC